MLTHRKICSNLQNFSLKQVLKYFVDNTYEFVDFLFQVKFLWYVRFFTCKFTLFYFQSYTSMFRTMHCNGWNQMFIRFQKVFLEFSFLPKFEFSRCSWKQGCTVESGIDVASPLFLYITIVKKVKKKTQKIQNFQNW